MNIILKRSPAYKVSWYRQYVRKSFLKTFARFSNVIKDASVYLSDENGPKGGLDKSCKLVINIVDGEKIIIKDSKRDWSIAIQNALKRAKQIIAGKIERSQGKYRQLAISN